MAVIATPKSASADVWGTLVEADAYHANRGHNTEWTGATDAVKEQHMKWACSLLNKKRWKGLRTTQSQAQAMPRTGLYDYDGYYIDSDVVYKDLKEASFEYAFKLIKSDTTEDPSTGGFKKIKVAVIDIEVDKTDRNKALPDSVAEMIKPWIKNYGSFQVGKG